MAKYNYEFKKRCVDAYKSNEYTIRKIYNDIYVPEYQGLTFNSFKRALLKWSKNQMADDATLYSGTYGDFIPHGATVQVDKDGEVIQAWIKQSAASEASQILEAIREGYTPIDIPKKDFTQSNAMLEIPLFDMHFGIATLKTYYNQYSRLVNIINREPYDQINIIIGQDVLHNNDMRGHTANGTDIEKVNFKQAWKDAFSFWDSIIFNSASVCGDVRVLYSKGNHDECSAWCLFKALEQRYPDLYFDDSTESRKVIYWKKCMIGYGHCEYSSKLDKIFRDFVCDFPNEFSKSKVKEIHTGHLHRESEDNGFMARRLSSATPSDDWSKNNGFIGTNKRFQVFIWEPGRLRSIEYL